MAEAEVQPDSSTTSRAIVMGSGMHNPMVPRHTSFREHVAY